MNIAEFRPIYPTDTLLLPSGKSFPYRYYKNPQAKVTIALLTTRLLRRQWLNFCITSERKSGLWDNLLEALWRRLLLPVIRR